MANDAKAVLPKPRLKALPFLAVTVAASLGHITLGLWINNHSTLFSYILTLCLVSSHLSQTRLSQP